MMTVYSFPAGRGIGAFLKYNYKLDNEHRSDESGDRKIGILRLALLFTSCTTLEKLMT